ncbi:MAG TPA: ABC transporter substrate-binding protein [Verrucomicrobiae bacterium]|jgi:ABC-type nitrate/sulfonate/bicarbonate transport system substrate-binding protein|nr:ABC transporter substrate-binding protein [Verrucomicrobiae bacterium]
MKPALTLLAIFFPVLAHTAAPENVRVAYPSMNTSVYGLIIAQKEGYLKEEGLDVQILSIRGEIAIRTVLAGEVDFFTNAGSALAAAVRNVPVKIVTVFQDKPSWDLIALPTIKSIAQLRGQNVAIMSPEGSLAVVAREILKQNGLDPAKDVNLVVMGGDEVRLPALQAKAIQATLFNTGTSIKAQREGFTKLASAGDYSNLIQGGLATSDEKIKQNPNKIFRLIRASLKGLRFFAEKRDPAIKYMMEALRLTDRQTANEVYDIESKLVLRDGVSSEKTLQAIIDDMRKTTKTAREIKTTDIFDLSFVKKAAEQLKASGWKP